MKGHGRFLGHYEKNMLIREDEGKVGGKETAV